MTLMLCIISYFIVSLGKFLIHLCFAQRCIGKEKFCNSNSGLRFSGYQKKKNGMETCFCLNQIITPYSFHKVPAVT